MKDRCVVAAVSGHPRRRSSITRIFAKSSIADGREGQGVVKCDPDTNEPRKFSTFCPKAIASKGKKAPDTILSRAIFITQKRRTRGETVAHFSHIDDDGLARLRSQLARWAEDNGEILGHARPAMPDGFMNRTASNWQLLFAIADSLGEEAGHRVRAAAQQIVGMTDLTSAGVELLQDSTSS
jgi:hypothetical protein